jgi:hypothetical protein
MRNGIEISAVVKLKHTGTEKRLKGGKLSKKFPHNMATVRKHGSVKSNENRRFKHMWYDTMCQSNRNKKQTES